MRGNQEAMDGFVGVQGGAASDVREITDRLYLVSGKRLLDRNPPR
jgi:hypothetical protein